MMKRDISFNSTIENIGIAEKLVDEIAEKYSISPDVYGNIMLSVVEAVSNAISHGNKNDANKLVQLSSDFKNDMLEFCISDQGEGFNYGELPDPTSPQHIEEPYGRGIFLISMLSDELSYYDNGSKVIIKFKI